MHFRYGSVRGFLASWLSIWNEGGEFRCEAPPSRNEAGAQPCGLFEIDLRSTATAASNTQKRRGLNRSKPSARWKSQALVWKKGTKLCVDQESVWRDNTQVPARACAREFCLDKTFARANGKLPMPDEPG